MLYKEHVISAEELKLLCRPLVTDEEWQSGSPTLRIKTQKKPRQRNIQGSDGPPADFYSPLSSFHGSPLAGMLWAKNTLRALFRASCAFDSSIDVQERSFAVRNKLQYTSIFSGRNILALLPLSVLSLTSTGLRSQATKDIRDCPAGR